ncbi:MAG: DUF3418 domain-containing protein, partial [Phycisphaerales bacterium]|nr:DUF3418 domain-containing protein [Phycisphaerales bacterium]
MRDRRGRRRRGDRSNEPLPPLQRQPGAPVNAGAVHRAVLSGLVSSVGMRHDDGDYVGPKGTRFRIFPGSALFRQSPTWIVAAELVETTRLYARTVARIRADWIERVVPHLVRREVFEPHWLRDAGQVAAWEKVSFQGLVLVAKRRVPFGPIDPVAARDVFIQSALVEESIRTDGAFLAANRELVARLEREEAKKRQRSVIVDLQARFAFYDARLPADVHSTPSFERWRRVAEARDPRLLHMRAADLLHPGAERPEATAFPDHLEVAGMRFPLAYRHEPGDPDDGVTASVPIAALTQLPADRLEWLVPGLLREKVLAMIRSLPKRLRVRFVPAPEYADGAVEALRFGEGSLPVRLAAHLARLSGTGVTASDFERSNVPEHLLLNLRLVDDTGKTVASGRDLAALQARFAPQSRAALQRAAIADSSGAAATGGAADAPPVRHNIVQWDFGPLPARVELRRLGTVVPAFPALIDEGTSAGLHMMESPAAAETATRRGVRRLLSIA